MSLESQKLGPGRKEAEVYLAVLSAGYGPAGRIAKQAGVSRPTAYEVLRSLKEKGLVVESKEKGKKYFSAESPDRIPGMLRAPKREVQEKEREFLRIISEKIIDAHNGRIWAESKGEEKRSKFIFELPAE